MSVETADPSLHRVADDFCALHASGHSKRREALLLATVADDVEFYGLELRTRGREEFAAAFQGAGHIRRTTPVDSQPSGWFRFGWELTDVNGEVMAGPDGAPYAGLAVLQRGDDGRILRAVAFRGLAPT